MPAIHYEIRLLNEVLPFLLSGALQTRYRMETAALYSKYLPEDRAEVFAALDARMFQELPQHKAFEKALRDTGPFPGVRDVMVSDARGMEEGADLNTSRDVAVLRVRFRRVSGDIGTLRSFLLHEFTHLADLLDPAFGYQREDPAPGEVRTWANLVRDRYRVLWNASVDGRLARRGEVLSGARAARHAEVLRAFAGFGEADAARVFEQAWTGELSDHGALIGAARRRGAVRTKRGPRPGGTCPLCGFSSWEWASAPDAAQAVIAVRADFGAWEPDEGLCGRCLEIYQLRSEDGTWRSTEGTC